MSLKGGAIFKEKLAGGLKNDKESLVNFHASSRRSENLHFEVVVLPRACIVLDAKRVISHDTEE